MVKRVSEEQRQVVLRSLAKGEDRETIAAKLGLTTRQVSAIAAHVTMGTYSLPGRSERKSDQHNRYNKSASQNHDAWAHNEKAMLRPVLLGPDAETGKEVYWNPDPHAGSVNPHVLVLGESGFGKTYTICCLLKELAQRQIVSIVFDYGQGFSKEALPAELISQTSQIQASSEGIDINPLQIFPTDLLGPLNVAQRVADSFARVYPKIGVQQHATLRQAILEVMRDHGITPEDASSWGRDLPAFTNLQRKLKSFTNDPTHSRSAASVASHLSTIFVFNTFRSNGHKLSWSKILDTRNGIFIIQLKGLESSLEKAVTEFLLWNLIGYVHSKGPSPLRCFVVLDEAHRLSLSTGSPVEHLLREGRKFGLGLILASQQPEDFSAIAFANTATKLVFQVDDDHSFISRQLFRKVRNSHTLNEIHEAITKLPRGFAYLVSENMGRVVEIASLAKRGQDRDSDLNEHTRDANVT
jgi:hypothetical protein